MSCQHFCISSCQLSRISTLQHGVSISAFQNSSILNLGSMSTIQQSRNTACQHVSIIHKYVRIPACLHDYFISITKFQNVSITTSNIQQFGISAFQHSNIPASIPECHDFWALLCCISIMAFQHVSFLELQTFCNSNIAFTLKGSMSVYQQSSFLPFMSASFKYVKLPACMSAFQHVSFPEFQHSWALWRPICGTMAPGTLAPRWLHYFIMSKQGDMIITTPGIKVGK